MFGRGGLLPAWNGGGLAGAPVVFLGEGSTLSEPLRTEPPPLCAGRDDGEGAVAFQADLVEVDGQFVTGGPRLGKTLAETDRDPGKVDGG